MKIIFLDIDGVLNSKRYFDSPFFKEETKDMSFAELLMSVSEINIDPTRVTLVNKIVEESGAEVVLSSSWRLFFDLEKIEEMLILRGAKFKLKDKTLRIFSDSAERGLEIKTYLNSHDKVESFVILDDFEDMGELEPFLVKTNADIGLTEDDVVRALEILSKEIHT